jgi:hypothetical protein
MAAREERCRRVEAERRLDLGSPQLCCSVDAFDPNPSQAARICTATAAAETSHYSARSSQRLGNQTNRAATSATSSSGRRASVRAKCPSD